MLSWTRANVTEIAKQERKAFHAETAIEVAPVVFREATKNLLGDEAGQNARSIIEDLRRQSQRFAAQAEGRARDAIKREAGVHTKKWVASVSAGAQIDISKLLADDDLVDLISIKSEQFVGLIKNLTDDMAFRIERQVLGSIFEGRSNADVAKALQEIEGIGRNRARLIARDQASKLNGVMNQFRQEQAGVTHYIWKTIMDGRERQSHHDRNEKPFAWDKPPSDGHPGQAVQCRCRALALLIEDPEDAAPLATQGDPGDPFDTESNGPLLQTVAGTMSEDVLSWSREATLIRHAEVRRAQEIVAAAKAEASYALDQAEELFEQIFGFSSEGQDLGRMSGLNASFTRQRVLIFAAIKKRLDTIEELLEHAADTASH